ncbi:hypothetical protein HDV05_006047 [Chytridiales sp. JEL 0842]|nr:hypothetical protein HDV05_006047 [Chytridiales sp. JEL 0842]
MVTVLPVPVNADNYAYLLLTNPAAKTCAAVDPAEPDKVLKAAEEKGWTVDTILTATLDHHHDHSGGNEDIVKMLPAGVPVYGGDDRIPAMTIKVTDKQTFKLGELEVTPLYTLCHTLGSVSYYVTDSKGNKAVFTGDTLFIAGCGRFFEGTPEQMHHSLNAVLGSLPDDTKVYVGHEYTTSNLKFAAHVEPENVDIKAKLEWCKSNPITVPGTIGEEKKINPFMRVGVAGVVKKVLGEGAGAVEVMGKLREMKNNF